MLDLMSSKPEYIEELRAEVSTMLNETGGSWTKAMLAKITKLDPMEKHNDFIVYFQLARRSYNPHLSSLGEKSSTHAHDHPTNFLDLCQFLSGQLGQPCMSFIQDPVHRALLRTPFVSVRRTVSDEPVEGCEGLFDPLDDEAKGFVYLRHRKAGHSVFG